MRKRDRHELRMKDGSMLSALEKMKAGNKTETDFKGRIFLHLHPGWSAPGLSL